MTKYTIEDLQAAGLEMAAKNLDYEDNRGSSDRQWFWNESDL